MNAVLEFGNPRLICKSLTLRNNSRFGVDVSLNYVGNLLAFGVERSGDHPNAVLVYERNNGMWQLQDYLRANEIGAHSKMGRAVRLSADGLTLVIGARQEDGAATGVNGDENVAGVRDAGAVYVYVRRDGRWQRQAYLKSSNTRAHDNFGSVLSISADGNTLAIGASGDQSAATGVNGDPDYNYTGPNTPNFAHGAGAVYLLLAAMITGNSKLMSKPAILTTTIDLGRFSISLSADGNTMAVGATGEDSAATGVNGNQADNSASDVAAADPGAVYLY